MAKKKEEKTKVEDKEEKKEKEEEAQLEEVPPPSPKDAAFRRARAKIKQLRRASVKAYEPRTKASFFATAKRMRRP